MKRLGLVGGTSWVSTAEYYAVINRLANERQGGDEFADLVLVSLNFGMVSRNVAERGHEANRPVLVEAGMQVKAAGAQAIVLCANTKHMFADDVAEATGLPVIHIAVATAAKVRAAGLRRVALLGTLATMEMSFYRDKLAEHGVETLIPEAEDRQFIQRTIFQELAKEIFSDDTRAEYVRIINDLVAQGAEGAILGCTEIPLLVKPGDVSVPTFDTTTIHAEAAVDFMLG